MTFQFNYTGLLKKKLAKLFKRNKKRYEIVMKKIEEIASSDELEIERYKNLRYDRSDEKRVHIDKSFVLTFKVDKAKKIYPLQRFRPPRQHIQKIAETCGEKKYKVLNLQKACIDVYGNRFQVS